MDNRQSSLNMNHLLAIKTGRYLLLTTLDSMGNARLLLSSTVTMTLGKVDRKNDGLVDIGSIVVGKAEDRVSGSLKIESAVRRCAYMARAIAEDSQITVNVLGKYVYHCDFSW